MSKIAETKRFRSKQEAVQGALAYIENNQCCTSVPSYTIFSRLALTFSVSNVCVPTLAGVERCAVPTMYGVEQPSVRHTPERRCSSRTFRYGYLVTT